MASPSRFVNPPRTSTTVTSPSCLVFALKVKNSSQGPGTVILPQGGPNLSFLGMSKRSARAPRPTKTASRRRLLYAESSASQESSVLSCPGATSRKATPIPMPSWT